MKRCPEGAISEQGHSNIKCRQYIRDVQAAKLKESVGLVDLTGMVITCGLRWSGVPCEDRILNPGLRGQNERDDGIRRPRGIVGSPISDLLFSGKNALVEVRILRPKYTQKQIRGSNIPFISTGL